MTLMILCTHDFLLWATMVPQNFVAYPISSNNSLSLWLVGWVIPVQ